MWSVCLSIYVVYNSTYIVLTLSLLKNRESQFLPSSLLNETAVQSRAWVLLALGSTLLLEAISSDWEPLVFYQIKLIILVRLIRNIIFAKLKYPIGLQTPLDFSRCPEISLFFQKNIWRRALTDRAKKVLEKSENIAMILFRTKLSSCKKYFDTIYSFFDRRNL